MLHRSFKPAKCKTALKLATSRIKLMKNKKENHLKQLKRELSQLLESGQDKTASIRVEHVVREEKMIAAYDLIDIYCELIVARLPIIDSQKTCPIDLKEAVTSVVFATPRCGDIPELQDVRKHFTAKYGKEFINSALEVRPGCGVSRMLVEKLSANAPDGQTKLKILSAIAEEHNIEWDPKSFGEKESKPYDDLLKGPNAFHAEPPIVQASPTTPNVNFSQGHNQWHDVPVNNQQNLHSPSPQSFASSDFSTTQASHHPTRPSGPEYDRTEVKHSYLKDENTYSLGRQNWNMEFKDATAAAQAAAESAERASMAARAAAELSTRERITRQNSHESLYSNYDDMRNERPRRNNESPSEKFVRNTNHNQNPAKGTEKVDVCDDEERHYKDTITRQNSNESLRSNADGIRDEMRSKNSGLPSEKSAKHTDFNSSGDKRGKPSTQTEKVDTYVHKGNYNDDERHYKNDHSSAKRYGQSASSKSETASLSVKDKRPVNSFYEVDRYSQKSSSDDEVVKLENIPSLSGMRVNKQSSGEDRNSCYPSSSSDDGDDNVNTHGYRNFVFDDRKDSFDHEKTHREAVDNDNVVFDSYVSDDEIIKFDKQPQYDGQESSFYSPSITRNPSNHFEVNVNKGSSCENTVGSFKKPLSASRVSAELFSTPHFDENSPKSPSSARIEDFTPATFDDSRGPSSDSEDEIEKNTFRGKLDPAIQSYKESNIFRKQELLYSSDDREYDEVSSPNITSQSRTKFDYDGVSSPHSSSPRRNSKLSLSPQSSRLSSVNELKVTDDLYTSASTGNTKNEVFNQASLESDNELKFTTLTGGLRNKGYKTPPYTKSAYGDSLSSKGANEDSLTYTQNVPVSPMVDSNPLSSKVGPKVEDNLSSRTRFKNKYLGSDDIEEKLPQENLKIKSEYAKENSLPGTRVKSYDLGIEELEEELPEPKLANKQDKKKDYTKNSSSRARVKKNDLCTDDIEEKLPQQNLQTKSETTLENSISRSRVKRYDFGVDEFEGGLSTSKLPNKQEVKNNYTKSKFSAPAGYFDSDENDSDENLPKQPSSFKVRPESGFSRRTKIENDSERNSLTKTKRGSPASVNLSSVSENRSNEKDPITRPISEEKQKLSKTEHPFPKRGSPSSLSSGSVSENRSNSAEKHSTTRSEPKEKEKLSKMEQPSSPLKTATSSSGEGPSREGSLKKASHVHPKLPDYDSFAAHFQSLRQSRD